jgi:pantothenate kinase
MESEYRNLANIIRQKACSHNKPRYLVAIAGVPGSGKTTTAEAVVQELNADPKVSAALLSMDGFHLPRADLDKLPNSTEAYARRGAPWTFDVARFVAFVGRLRVWADNTPLVAPNSGPWTTKDTIRAPAFDHKAKDPTEGGIAITPDASIIIIEGNYLLLDEPGWRDLAELVDYRIFVDTDLLEARERTARRHVHAGIEKTLEDGYRRVDSNDYLNGISIRDKLLAPDIIIKSVTVNDTG